MGSITVLQFHKIGEQLALVSATENNLPSAGSAATVHGLLPYTFKLPTVEQSIGLLNALCKFEEPSLRLQVQLKEWLLKLWVPPKPTVCSPRDWSVGLCFQAVRALLNTQVMPLTTGISHYHNKALHRLLWEWEVAQCQPLPWLMSLWPATVAWQPWKQPTLLPEHTGLLRRFFKQNQLDEAWLTAVVVEQWCLQTALWGALWQQQQLPWFDLLTMAEQQGVNLVRFPYVQRLQWAYEAEQTQQENGVLVPNTSVKPIQQLILVEGESERCLLPAMAQVLGTPLAEKGVWILSCGGKSATLQRCLSLLKWVKLPIAVLLDADATAEAQQLQQWLVHQPALERQLNVCILTEGELEDTYPLVWIYAVLRQLDVGLPNRSVTATTVPTPLDTRHGVQATIPSFEVFEAFMHTGALQGERASTLLHRFWVQWGYPSFDKRELAQGIAKYLQVTPAECLLSACNWQENSLWVWLKTILKTD